MYCDRVIEAGWLAALAVVPLFFNPYGVFNLEAEKAALARSIALVMALAWLIRLAEGRGSASWPVSRPAGAPVEIRLNLDFLRSPLVVGVGLLVIAYLVATLASVTPRISFWGSYYRQQGAYTVLSYITIFALALGRIRTWEQVERLITVTLLTSWPVALFGVLQYFGLDPVPWTHEPGRVFSTMGNPIFLGGYLVMVIPLSIVRLYRALAGAGQVPQRAVAALAYGVLLALQLLCLLLTQSRGPWMAWLAGMFLFAMLGALIARRRRLGRLVAVIAMVVLLFIAGLNVAGGPLESLRNVQFLNRAAHMLDSPTLTQRILTWRAVERLATSDPPRAFIGYGPDTQRLVLVRTVPPGLLRIEGSTRPDRAHNDLFDTLTTTGLLGVAATLLIFGALFYYGLRGLGLVTGVQDRYRIVGLLVAGPLTGGVGLRLVSGSWAFSGIAMALGLVAAVAIWVGYQLVAQPALLPKGADDDRVWIAALVAVLVAHFVDINASFGTTATRVTFWVYAALLLALCQGVEKPAQAAFRGEPAHPRRKAARGRAGLSGVWDWHVGAYALLAGLVLGTLGSDFVLLRGFDPTAHSFSIPLLLLTTWLAGGVLLSGERVPGHQLRSTGWLYLTVSLVWFLLFMAVRAVGSGGEGIKAYVWYVTWLLGSAGVVAAVLPRDADRPGAVWAGMGGIVYSGLVLAAGLLIWHTNVNSIRADVYLSTALANANAGRFEISTFLLQRLVQLAPDQDQYYARLAQSYSQQAQATRDEAPREQLFDAARQAMERAVRLSPQDPSQLFNLAHTYLTWAQRTTDQARRTERLDQALAYYEQAAALSPTDPRVMLDWAQAHELHGDLEVALELYQRAGQLDPAAALPYKLQAMLYLKAGRVEEVHEAAQEASRRAGSDFATHRDLAMIYQRLGRMDEALAEAQLAWKHAPDDHQKRLMKAFLEAIEKPGE